MSHAYVLVEHTDNQVDDVTAELITAARVFGAVSAVVVGAPGTAEALAPSLAQLGADQIVAATAADTATRVVLPEVDALSMLGAANPAPIIVASSPAGDEIAARLAVRLSSGVVSDAVGINADGSSVQSVFGDTIEVTATVGGQTPIYALRPGAVDAEPRPAAGELAAMELPAAGALDVEVASFTPSVRGQRPELAQAKVVIAGGRGVGSEEGFRDIVEPLADAFGGAVGATRDAIDHGWYAGKYQIGQTGVSVAPDLYIGLGISGAIQHKAGMQTAKTIVVVNNDEDAPLFEIADLGIVGDLFEIAPALTEEIKRRKQG